MYRILALHTSLHLHLHVIFIYLFALRISWITTPSSVDVGGRGSLQRSLLFLGPHLACWSRILTPTSLPPNSALTLSWRCDLSPLSGVCFTTYIWSIHLPGALARIKGGSPHAAPRVPSMLSDTGRWGWALEDAEPALLPFLEENRSPSWRTRIHQGSVQHLSPRPASSLLRGTGAGRQASRDSSVWVREDFLDPAACPFQVGGSNPSIRDRKRLRYKKARGPEGCCAWGRPLTVCRASFLCEECWGGPGTEAEAGSPERVSFRVWRGKELCQGESRRPGRA